jgi:2-isopropylmalate synthase
MVAKHVKGPVIAALARAIKKDIDVAWDAIKASERPRIHTFLATSDIHLEYKLKIDRDKALETAVEAVKYAKKYTPDVEFSAEDASRSDKDFLCKVYTAVIDAGATVINVPDTVGYTTPYEYGELIKYLQKNIPNLGNVDISVHCHNDLGLAVANSLSALVNGATQLECTINGLGERAGNAALEELIMALITRKEYYKAYTNIDTKHIYRISKLVSTLTGVPVQPNKAIVGENAFAHESGIHQHGVLSNPMTYEIMNPEAIGISRSNMVLGKHSGRHAFVERLTQLGYDLDNDTVNDLFKKFKELADRKKTIFDRDIEALVSDKPELRPEWYKLVFHQVFSGSKTVPTATVRLDTSDGVIEEAGCGDGPVDAVFKAIEKAIGFEVNLKDYNIKAVTSGEDALGEAIVWVERDGKVFSGRGLSTDVVESSAKAFINAINKMLAVCGHPHTNETRKNGSNASNVV